MVKRIALIEFSPSGGLFQFSVQLGEALARAGAEVEVITGPKPELSSREPGCRVRGRELCRRQTPRHQRMIAFWACRRFSASSKITEWGPSMTALVTSSLRWAGRQCMNSAPGLARAIRSSFT